MLISKWFISFFLFINGILLKTKKITVFFSYNEYIDLSQPQSSASHPPQLHSFSSRNAYKTNAHTPVHLPRPPPLRSILYREPGLNFVANPSHVETPYWPSDVAAERPEQSSPQNVIPIVPPPAHSPNHYMLRNYQHSGPRSWLGMVNSVPSPMPIRESPPALLTTDPVSATPPLVRTPPAVITAHLPRDSNPEMNPDVAQPIDVEIRNHETLPNANDNVWHYNNRMQAPSRCPFLLTGKWLFMHLYIN